MAPHMAGTLSLRPAASRRLFQRFLYQGLLPWEPVDKPFYAGHLAPGQRVSSVVSYRNMLAGEVVLERMRHAADLPYGETACTAWLHSVPKRMLSAWQDRLAEALPTVSKSQNLRLLFGKHDFYMERNMFGVAPGAAGAEFSGADFCFEDRAGRTCFTIDTDKGCDRLLTWLRFYGLDERLLVYSTTEQGRSVRLLSGVARLRAFTGQRFLYVVRL